MLVALSLGQSSPEGGPVSQGLQGGVPTVLIAAKLVVPAEASSKQQEAPGGMFN